MNYFSRITISYQDLPQSFYDQIPCESLVIYEHPREEEDPVSHRTHIHLVILGLTLTIPGLKLRITSTLNRMVKRSDWSFKICNEEEVPKMLTYMSKGQYLPKYIRNMEIDSLDIISQWEDHAHQTSKPMRQLKITQMGAKEYKQTYNDLIDKIINLLEEGGDYQPRQIIETVISVFRKERTIIGRYKIRDIYDTVMMRKLPDHYIDKIISELKI